MMGVPNREPNTPPLLMVKVPPSMSSTASSFLRAYQRHTHLQLPLKLTTLVEMDKARESNKNVRIVLIYFFHLFAQCIDGFLNVCKIHSLHASDYRNHQTLRE